MALLVATDKYIVTAKELHVEYYNYSDHKNIDVPVQCKANEKDYISDIAVSNDGKHLAVVTTISKQLMVYDLLQMEHKKTFIIPRSASRIRFTMDSTQILVADKSGDILIYEINQENSGTKLLGHLSLLLDVLQTSNSSYIISSDRDEKIKVSCYPNTYNIQTYCLGHKEFVNHIELLPHDDEYLTSSSGDGTVKIWDYDKGKLCHTIDTSHDVSDDQLKQNFINMMDEGGIEVLTLPIVHYTISRVNKTISSIIALTVHTCNTILIYSISNQGSNFSHKLEHKLELERFPSAINLYNDTLFVYDDTNFNVNIYKLSESDGKFSVTTHSKIKMFESKPDLESKESQFEAIKVLYKRKFDNVQEYQERKKQRIEKCSK